MSTSTLFLSAWADNLPLHSVVNHISACFPPPTGTISHSSAVCFIYITIATICFNVSFWQWTLLSFPLYLRGLVATCLYGTLNPLWFGFCFSYHGNHCPSCHCGHLLSFHEDMLTSVQSLTALFTHFYWTTSIYKDFSPPNNDCPCLNFGRFSHPSIPGTQQRLSFPQFFFSLWTTMSY